MNIEDKLKEKVLDSVDFMGEHDLLSVTPFAPLVSLDDAISICKEAIKETKIEENKLILKESYGSHHWIRKHLEELESDK